MGGGRGKATLLQNLKRITKYNLFFQNFDTNEIVFALDVHSIIKTMKIFFADLGPPSFIKAIGHLPLEPN